LNLKQLHYSQGEFSQIMSIDTVWKFVKEFNNINKFCHQLPVAIDSERREVICKKWKNRSFFTSLLFSLVPSIGMFLPQFLKLVHLIYNRVDYHRVEPENRDERSTALHFIVAFLFFYRFNPDILSGLLCIIELNISDTTYLSHWLNSIDLSFDSKAWYYSQQKSNF